MERKKELQTGHAWEAHRVKQASIPVGEILERGDVEACTNPENQVTETG